ncbi:MAG TPA: ATP-binding protein [Thermoanaerobaculia bacterium]|nr:ATP-binding protein [Thermoanaerobaculia bacterium]
MTDPVAAWEQGNDAYLGAALTWLHLRLKRLAPSGQSGQSELARPPVPPPSSAPPAGGPAPGRPAAPSGKDRPLSRSSAKAAATAAAAASSRPTALPLPAAGQASLEQQIEAAAAAMAAAEAADPPPALVLLGQRLGLARFEREVLLLCAAMELDTRTAALCARAQDDPSRPYPTFALALALFEDAAWQVLSPEAPLRRWRLIEINQPGAQPLTASPLRADERIVNYVKGLNYLDDRLATLLLELAPRAEEEGEAELPPSQSAAVEAILQRLQQTAAGRRLPAVQLVGPDPASKQDVARHIAGTLGLRLYRLPAELLPVQAGDLETLARLLQREAALWPLALYLDAHDLDRSASAEGQPPPLARFLARSGGLFFVGVRDVRPELGEAGEGAFALDVGKAAPAEQRAAWAAALGDAAPGSPALLAGQFSLSLAAIRRVAREALAVPVADEQDLHRRLWDASLAVSRPRLDALAQRLEPKATWEDIVLPATQKALLEQIAAQVEQRSKVYGEWGFADKRNRGLGINALFAGESGTGKTMAAEVIANELRLSLYRIDLSAVVSKYIGETEKNLRRLFDAAEDGGAILFFDEADALFGKRSEVKDSHDRYANIEVNYLLQRIESYRGLAILATNMRSALDTAFLRRLRFIVEFNAQSPVERREIWRRIFPPATPTAGLDLDRLARLNLKGGDINNVAINAAFLAARAGTPVNMPLVLAAARTECEKLKLPINHDDFAWREPAAVTA